MINDSHRMKIDEAWQPKTSAVNTNEEISYILQLRKSHKNLHFKVVKLIKSILRSHKYLHLKVM